MTALVNGGVPDVSLNVVDGLVVLTLSDADGVAVERKLGAGAAASLGFALTQCSGLLGYRWSGVSPTQEPTPIQAGAAASPERPAS